MQQPTYFALRGHTLTSSDTTDMMPQKKPFYMRRVITLY